MHLNVVLRFGVGTIVPTRVEQSHDRYQSISSNPPTKHEQPVRKLVGDAPFDGPVRLVFDAWTKPQLFKLWSAPKSCGVRQCCFTDWLTCAMISSVPTHLVTAPHLPEPAGVAVITPVRCPPYQPQTSDRPYGPETRIR